MSYEPRLSLTHFAHLVIIFSLSIVKRISKNNLVVYSLFYLFTDTNFELALGCSPWEQLPLQSNRILHLEYFFTGSIQYTEYSNASVATLTQNKSKEYYRYYFFFFSLAIPPRFRISQYSVVVVVVLLITGHVRILERF